MMHIWDLGASSNQLFYWKFNQKINVLTNKVEITGANLALWDVTKMRFAHATKWECQEDARPSAEQRMDNRQSQ
mgnify:CR=1 FL=1